MKLHCIYIRILKELTNLNVDPLQRMRLEQHILIIEKSMQTFKDETDDYKH